jgi:hypothetical protein
VQNSQHFYHFWAQIRFLIPAVLRQYPQLVREGRMGRARWALSLQYGQHNRGAWAVAKWSRTGKYLCKYGETVNQSSAHSGLVARYLDHDHCEGENIRFLAVCLFSKDLWSSPLRGVTSEAKICDACTASTIY